MLFSMNLFMPKIEINKLVGFKIAEQQYAQAHGIITCQAQDGPSQARGRGRAYCSDRPIHSTSMNTQTMAMAASSRFSPLKTGRAKSSGLNRFCR